MRADLQQAGCKLRLSGGCIALVPVDQYAECIGLAKEKDLKKQHLLVPRTVAAQDLLNDVLDNLPKKLNVKVKRAEGVSGGERWALQHGFGIVQYIGGTSVNFNVHGPRPLSLRSV
mmetsp:Transcript_33785/g.78954  ORF Transcript_33785/g.78954 Transcript_33785/m.78954 type:complete len:116 (+) Transcript_33785:1001-1348(+)